MSIIDKYNIEFNELGKNIHFGIVLVIIGAKSFSKMEIS